MSYFPPIRDQSLERTPMGSPESPAANADTRAIVTWLMQVQYHGGMASSESRGTLLALAHAIPANADALDPDLASVVAAIQSFAHTAICDPLLADKASHAIDSLTAKLSSPVRVVSPSKKATAPFRFSERPAAVKKLDFGKDD